LFTNETAEAIVSGSSIELGAFHHIDKPGLFVDRDSFGFDASVDINEGCEAILDILFDKL
jgi:hypothetical protein